MSGDISWTSKPLQNIANAKEHARQNLHRQNPTGLTALEQAFWHALRKRQKDTSV